MDTMIYGRWPMFGNHCKHPIASIQKQYLPGTVTLLFVNQNQSNSLLF